LKCKIELSKITSEEKSNNLNYTPKFSLLDYLSKSKREIKTAQAASQYQEALNLWKESFIRTNKEKENTVNRYNKLKEVWKKEKQDYYLNQETFNNNIDLFNENYI